MFTVLGCAYAPHLEGDCIRDIVKGKDGHKTRPRAHPRGSPLHWAWMPRGALPANGLHSQDHR